jgi:hypothetical protein
MMKASIRLKAEVSQRSSLLSQYWVIGENHATLTGCDQFIGIETKTAQRSETATTTPCRMTRAACRQILGTVDLCRVFNNGKAMPFCQI